MIIAIDIGGATVKVASYKAETLSVPLKRTTPRDFSALSSACEVYSPKTGVALSVTRFF